MWLLFDSFGECRPTCASRAAAAAFDSAFNGNGASVRTVSGLSQPHSQASKHNSERSLDKVNHVHLFKARYLHLHSELYSDILLNCHVVSLPAVH